MADAALAWSNTGREVYFITVEPSKTFYSAKGRETLLQLLSKERNTVKILKARAGREFEFGTPKYRSYVYKQLIAQLPQGTPIILSDDKTIWAAATAMQGVYPVIGVLHADENHYYDLAEKYFKRTDLLVCVSNRVSNTTKARVPDFDPEAVFTIPCGIHLPLFDQNNRNGDLLQLVYVGRITDYQKRTGDLVKVAEALVRKSVPFHLNIIGGGDARPALEEKVKAAGMQDHITFKGWLSQKDVAWQLADSDIMVMTSDFEGTPIAMMEALAAGCGMVGTRVSGIEDYEDHPLAKDCFAVFNVTDIGNAADKIIAIGAIPEHIRRSSARKLAESEFSMQVCLARYDAALAAIPSRSGSLPNMEMPVKDKLYSKALSMARSIKMRLQNKK